MRIFSNPELNRCHHDTVWRSAVFAIMLEGFEEQFWRRRRGKVETDHLQIGQRTQRREQRHCLTRTRRTAEAKWFVFGEPSVEQGLVTNRVERGNDDVGGRHAVSLNLDLDKGWKSLVRIL